MATLENIHQMKVCATTNSGGDIYLDGKVSNVEEIRKIEIVNLLECEK